jgi:acetoacetyl-CoA synthetase
VVEAVHGVSEALVVDLEPGAAATGAMILFVAPAAGAAVDDDLRSAIRAALRDALSPRHVPDRIVQVEEIPHTLNGKKVEVPVKRILRGEPAERVLSRDALARPEAIEPFVALAARLAAGGGLP